jgi:hypothetical protein
MSNLFDWVSIAFSDVGGGYIRDDTDTQDASNVPFRWMLHEINEVGCIYWDNFGLDYLKVPNDCIPRIESNDTEVESSNSKVQDESILKLKWIEEDSKDALAKHHDMLQTNRWWYFFQWPTWTENGWKWTGRRTFFKSEASHIHWTVKERANRKDNRPYVPKAFLPPKWKDLAPDGPDN